MHLTALMKESYFRNSTTIIIHINIQLGNSEATKILDNQVLAIVVISKQQDTVIRRKQNKNVDSLKTRVKYMLL